MLRVTPKSEETVEILEIEGKLSGEWVVELERCWREHPAQPGGTAKVYLKAVTYIDEAGKRLLSEMHRSGVELVACGCMTRAVVEEIKRGAIVPGLPVKVNKILTLILLGVCMFRGT